MRAVKWLAAVGIVVAVLATGWHLFRKNVYVSLGYCVEARFSSLPPNDKELCEWLKSQPGVVRHTVWISREGADRKLLKVGFIMSQNLYREPPFPDLGNRCKLLGYAGNDSGFKDSQERSQSQSTCD